MSMKSPFGVKIRKDASVAVDMAFFFLLFTSKSNLLTQLKNNQIKERKTAMTAHMGIRGIASVWIALYHFVYYSSLGFDLQGEAVLPFFFMLSGFSLSHVFF